MIVLVLCPSHAIRSLSSWFESTHPCPCQSSFIQDPRDRLQAGVLKFTSQPWFIKICRSWWVWENCFLSVLGRTAGLLTLSCEWKVWVVYCSRFELPNTLCSDLRLRGHISSYLDAPGLCAQRATAPESSSQEACCTVELSVNHVAVAQAFVAQLIQLVRPETPLAQMRHWKLSVEVICTETKKQFVARPDVLIAAADIYITRRNKEKKQEMRQALARNHFQVFAGLQGATMLVAQIQLVSIWFLLPTV